MSTYDRIIITGGGGMLAQAILRAFNVRDIHPRSLTRSQLDITDRSAIDAMFRDLRPTLIINCAAYTKVDLAEQEKSLAESVNGNGPGYLAVACAASHARLVHFSTDFVFDGTSKAPYQPAEQSNPLSTYGLTKLQGEVAIRATDADALIIRTSWLYGPGGPNFVQTMLRVARAGKPLTVVDDQIGSPTLTYEVAEATIDLLDRGARGTMHVTNSGQTSWFGFARAIFEEFGVTPIELSTTTSHAWKASHPTSAIRPAYSVLDCGDTERVIGRTLSPWRKALRRYRDVAKSSLSARP